MVMGCWDHVLPDKSTAESDRLAPFPSVGLLVLAFAVVYLGYGLNFLAVKVAVETMPAFLFAGAHVLLAGVLLMAWRGARHSSLGLPRGGMARAAVAALFLFFRRSRSCHVGRKAGVGLRCGGHDQGLGAFVGRGAGGAAAPG